MSRRKPVALLSVFHKEGIVEFAQALRDLGWRIIASGGTARELKKAGVPVMDVAAFVGGGAILGHRVVTLSRELHAGLLAHPVRDRDEMEKLGLKYIDLVCVDLYPLADAIAQPDADEVHVIENTDVGGPTMIHAAAKGRRIVICDPADRAEVIKWLKAGRFDEATFRRALAGKAEGVVAQYLLTSAEYVSERAVSGVIGGWVDNCRYGENAWQTPATLNAIETADPLAIPRFEVIAGEQGFVNWTDVDRLVMTATHIAAGADHSSGSVPQMAIGVKHGNPCGAGIGEDPCSAIAKMMAGDPLALFGGFVLVNFRVTEKEAEALLTAPGGKKQVLDGVIAPGFTQRTIDMLSRREGRCKLLVNPALAKMSKNSLDSEPRIRPIRGGFLRQPNYDLILDLGDRNPNREIIGNLIVGLANDIIFAWAIGSTSNSNTIIIVRDGQLLGAGVGQKDRCIACQLAVQLAERSGHNLTDAVAYSDSFFPFNDGPEVLIAAGVKTIFASSGSNNDERLKALCQDRGITLVLMPDEEIRGFFGH